MPRPWVRAAVAFLVLVLGGVAPASAAVLAHCGFQGSAGDGLARGFYLSAFPGDTVDTVTLGHRSASPGERKIRLTMRLNSYTGPLLGVAETTTYVNADMSPTIFRFDGRAVPPGNVLAFTQQVVDGDDNVLYDIGTGTCANITQTEGSAAPLDTFRRQSVGLSITGRVASTSPITVVEYFHTGFGHYFVTADADEIAGLDAGAFGGVFTRTGQTFKARDGPAAGAIAVCRFFTVAFAPLSSHVYTAEAAECGGLKSNPAWQYEKIAFYIPVPNAAGVCPSDTVPVYRLYNDGMTGAPNHRFTTSLAIHDDFVQNRGWTSEGIRFCAPAS